MGEDLFGRTFASHQRLGHESELEMVVARVGAECGKRDVHAHLPVLGQETLGLLDDDAGLQRCLGCSASNEERWTKRCWRMPIVATSASARANLWSAALNEGP